MGGVRGRGRERERERERERGLSDKPFVSLLGGVAIGGWSGVDGLPVNAFATIKVSIDQWELSFR